MYSLIDTLSHLTGLPDEALGIELAQQAQRYPIPALDIADWRRRERPRPVWVQRAAAHWIGALWHSARANCPPPPRRAVDTRYAAALDPALGEVYRLLEQFERAPGPVAPATLRQELGTADPSVTGTGPAPIRFDASGRRLMEPLELEPARATLAHVLDVLDTQGIPGMLIACLLPDGASLIRAGGLCTDLHGACLGLHVAVTAIRDLALSEHRGELAATLQTAADAIRTVIQTTTPPREH